jgi:NAD(P)-dependent dehydrogenase (short-subunit alcohol dehydrogenase family)
LETSTAVRPPLIHTKERPAMDLELFGRVAVVTGASKGIGLAITGTLAGEGARVVAASRTVSPGLEALDDVPHVAVDPMDPAAPAEVIAQAVQEHGRLDVLGRAARSSTSRRATAGRRRRSNVDYSAAKAALMNLTKALSEEFAPRAGDDGAHDGPPRRAAGDRADAVALLASPRSASTTGAEFVVDSGFAKAV